MITAGKSFGLTQLFCFGQLEPTKKGLPHKQKQPLFRETQFG
jgi:hypothetical protein